MIQNVETSEKSEKRKKFLLLLPLFILPILVLLFWKLGGSKGDTALQSAGQQGINTELPSAQFKGEKPQNKLNLYDQAAKDSIRANQDKGNSLFDVVKKDSAGLGQKSIVNGQSAAASAVQINKKLAQIRQQLSAPEATPVNQQQAYSLHMQPAVNAAQVDRLEKLMQNMKSSGGSNSDPQMQQLDGMITKLLQLQHPELVNQQIRQQEAKVKPDSAFKAIPAIIDGNQKVAPGGVVKLRLSDTLHIHGLVVPKGQLLFGACMVTNQRLILDIKNIRLGTAIIPVNLTVFSLDGLAGIAAPEAELGEAAGNGTSEALDNMEFMGMDETLGAQAATAGISAAKGLIGKKARKIRVKLKGGVTVLLRVNH